MGRLSLTDMLDHATPSQALAWHLQANLYPPPPAFMRQPAADAIDACNEGEPDRPIALPEGTLYRGEPEAPARAIIDSFRLEAFLDSDVL